MNTLFRVFLESVKSYNPTLIDHVINAYDIWLESVGDNQESTDVNAVEPDMNQSSGGEGDGDEELISVPEQLGFKVDGNKMSCNFYIPMRRGINTAPKSLENIKTRMAKVGLGFEYSIKPIREIKCTDGEVLIEYETLAEFTAPEFKRDGYEYLMTMERTEKGPFIIPAPSHKNDDFSMYYHKNTFTCDHCHSDRLRNVMHVFRKDGKNYTYGTSCAKEFFGINYLEKVSRAIYYMFTEFTRYASEYEEVFGGGSSSLNAPYLFKFAYVYFKENPFYEKGEMGTKGYLMNVFSPPKFDDDFRKVHDYYLSKIKKEHEQKYMDFLEFYNNLDIKTSFDYNLSIVAPMKSLDSKSGLFIYSIYHWMKESGELSSQKKLTETVPTVDSTYIGKEGDKLLFTSVNVMKIIPTESMYGVTYIHLMQSVGQVMTIDEAKKKIKNKETISVDSNGTNDAIVWFASNKSNLAEGGKYSITGTVTKHKDRDGKKQTVIKLVKLADVTSPKLTKKIETETEPDA